MGVGDVCASFSLVMLLGLDRLLFDNATRGEPEWASRPLEEVDGEADMAYSPV